MATSEGPRRLRLASATPHIEPFVSRCPTAGPVICVADWVPEAGALTWSTWLAAALAPAIRPLVVVCGFEHAPELPIEALAQLRSVSSVLVRAVEPSEAGALDLLRTGTGESGGQVRLFVGEPAVAALRAPLSVLVGTGAEAQKALPSLRPWREGTTLCLAAPRRSLAVALARDLAGTLSA